MHADFGIEVLLTYALPAMTATGRMGCNPVPMALVPGSIAMQTEQPADVQRRAQIRHRGRRERPDRARPATGRL